jgi:hypothetical protein
MKLLIAIQANYSYLRGWTYLLKIYRKRSQFASKSITCNDAFPLFCEVRLKGQPLPQPADGTSHLPREQSLRRPLKLVGQEREAREQQRLPKERVN